MCDSARYRKKELGIWWIASAFLALFICLTAQASCPDMPRFWEKLLRQKGFSVDSPGQIIEATKSESYVTRYLALQLLTHNTQEQAIPVLLKALEDERIFVRSTSAHLLGTLGDKSGLERMRQDLAELVPRGGAAEPADPNVAKDSYALKRWQRNRRHRLGEALDVALVLAELGDRRGYELAAKIAIESPAEQAHLAQKGEDDAAISMAVKRKRAVKVLAEIAKTDQKTLAEEGRDPVAVLCTLAASETRSTVFRRLLMAVGELRGDIAIEILDRAKDNPHQEQLHIRRATRSLETLRAKKALQNK